MHIIDAKRVKTMRSRLGETVSSLIKNDNFLPLFRNRQKNYQAEFEESVKIALKKDNPLNYLATIWSRKNLEKSLEWLRKIINKAKTKLADLKQKQREEREKKRFEEEFNPKGKARLNDLISKYRIGLST